MTDEDSQLYRDLMRLKPDGWTANAWAVNAGVSRTVWTDMRRHGNPSRRTLQKLLAAAGSSLAEFEALRVGDRPAGVDGDGSPAVSDSRTGGWQPSRLPPLPLVAAADAGLWGNATNRIALIELRVDQILAQLARPASLNGDAGAFVLTVPTNSMWPRFRPGRRVAVSPKAPVEAGDDILVMLAHDPAIGVAPALLVELVERATNHLELRQFHPDVSFRVDALQVSAIYKVVGELI